MSTIKKLFTSIPVIRYFIKIPIYVVLLPRKIVAIHHAIERDHAAISRLTDKTTQTNEQVILLIEKLKSANSQQVNYTNTIAELRHLLETAAKPTSTKTKAVKENKTFADNHSLDDFYLQFENKFRGGEPLIKDRLTIYLPYLGQLDKKVSSAPFLDIGCGRGEFLDLLTQHKHKVRGLDLNSSMVKRAKEKGYDVVEDDALSYLSDQKPESFAGISGFHLVEHIPFDELLRLFNECYRTVKQNGLVIFETPNPENLTVGSLNFYYDPSHLHPLPPQLLAFCLEYIGFKDVEILPLHPEFENIEHPEAMTQEVYKRIFGARDYAVIGYKK